MDVLSIAFSQDVYGPDDALAEVWLDGQLLGRPSIKANRKAGQAQSVTWLGDYGASNKLLNIYFKNDAWGGAGDKDRNLFVLGVVYNGTYVPVPMTVLEQTGSRLDVAIPGVLVPVASRGAPTLLIRDWSSFKCTSLGDKACWSNSMPPGANRSLNAGVEDEWYTDPSLGQYDPFSVNAAKQLIITARPAKDTGGNPAGYAYNSGCLSSDGFFQQQYGYFSFKMMLCSGAGWWPAGWMLPSAENFRYTCEADVMESWQGDQSYVQQTLIGPRAGVDAWPNRHVRPKVAGGADKAFHTFAMDWRKDKTKFFLDEVQTGEFDTPATMQGPMYMLMNLAVGKPGSWVGSPTPGAVGTLTIAEVAAYK